MTGNTPVPGETAQVYENFLYRDASSFDEYVDTNTLRQRSEKIHQYFKEMNQQKARHPISRSGANNTDVADSRMRVTNPPLPRGMEDKLSQQMQQMQLNNHTVYIERHQLKQQQQQLQPGGGGRGGSGQPYNQSYGGGNYGPASGENSSYVGGGQVSRGHPQEHHPHPQLVFEWNIPGVTLEKVRNKVQRIVEKSDKETLTVKSVRTTLEEWLDMDLAEHKDTIRSLTMEFL